MEKISVCMATYNGARFIRQQMDSILPQLKATDEVIISDDGSTDGTLSIALSYKDDRITILNNTRSGVPAKTFESGLRHCTGDLIFLADQDDVWMPHKIETMQRFLQTHDLVLSDCAIIDDQGKTLVNSFFAQQKSKKGFTQNLIRNSYMGCCMAFNRKVLEHILPFPNQLQIHDQWIGLVAEKHYNIYFIDQPLVHYRRHGLNYSMTSEKSSLSILKKINHRLHILYNIYYR